MPAHHPSDRAAQRKLREEMRALGMTPSEIAAEMSRRYKLRPRAAWRTAWGWTLEEAADRYTTLRARDTTGHITTLTGSRLSEWEHWPLSPRKPPVTSLCLLAEIYQCTPLDLIDIHDRHKLPAPDLLTLTKTTTHTPGHPPDAETPHTTAANYHTRTSTLPITERTKDGQPEPRPAHRSTGRVRVPSEDLSSPQGILATAPGIRDIKPHPGLPADCGSEAVQTALRGPVAPELVGYFSSQLAGHYSADRFLGPMRLIPTALSQYELLCDVASASAGSLRCDLWSVATGYAGLIGWFYQDGGDLGASARWHDVMIERAHRSQDVQLVAFALHCKAMLHADIQDGAGVLDLAGAGLRLQESLCPKVRVLLLQQAAHGVSLTPGDGVADECSRLLDEAAGLVAAIDDDYPWGGNSRTARYVDVQRATIWTRLGRAREALELWEQLIPDIPASSRRDLGVYRARQAQALAAAGEPEQAAAVAGEVMPLVAQTGSARMRAELAGLRQSMRPWKNQPPGQALEEALTGAGIA